MHERCFIPPSAWTEKTVQPSAEEAHYLCNVLRARDGDAVEVFDGQGRTGDARVRLIPAAREDGKPRHRHPDIRLEILSQKIFPPRRTQIILIQAPPKGAKSDWIIEKAVELGAAEIWMVFTERVTARPAAGQKAEREERWRRVALSAARQCHAPWLPGVRVFDSLKELLPHCAALPLLLVGSLAPAAQPLRAVLQRRTADAPEKIGLAIGPEGDLTDEEALMLERAGGVPVTFGTQVLRAETAALYGLSALAYELAAGR